MPYNIVGTRYYAQDSTRPPRTNFKADFLDNGGGFLKKTPTDVGVCGNPPFFLVCVPLVSEKIGSDTRPRGSQSSSQILCEACCFENAVTMTVIIWIILRLSLIHI